MFRTVQMVLHAILGVTAMAADRVSAGTGWWGGREIA